MLCDFHRGINILTKEQIVHKLVQHEKRSDTPKKPDAMVQRLMHAHLDSSKGQTAPLSDVDIESEVEVTMWAGIIDLLNIMALGVFQVTQDLEMQERLYEELISVWPDPESPVPAYGQLRKLKLLVCIPATRSETRDAKLGLADCFVRRMPCSKKACG
jgi:hypothetical protein